MRTPTAQVFFVASLLLWPLATNAEPLKTQLRRPVAAALATDEARLLVANERSGTVSIIDLKERKVVREVAVARRLADLIATHDGRQRLALDGETHELLRLKVGGDEIRVVERVRVADYPVRVVASADGRRAYVASLWSRRVTVVDLAETAKVAGTIDLAIAPRELLLCQEDTRLIAADSFAGKLAVIDTTTQKFLHTSEFPAHNIRGLAVSGDGKKLLVSHQMLNELGHTTQNDVHWGLVMTNDLRWLRLESVLKGQKDLYGGAHMHPLGHSGNAAGDPAGLAVAPDGRVVVTLAGTGEIAFGSEDDFSLSRADVGQRPTRVVISRDSKMAYVLNTFGDSVTCFALDAKKSLAEIPLGPTPALSKADRGELLFYDARLSHDKWMSCHSCHTDGHTNGQLNDNFSDKSFGAPKRVLSLLTTTDSAPFGWRGNAASLSEQIKSSVLHTMQGDEDIADEQIELLSAYVKTLAPPPSLDKARGSADAAGIVRGKELFTELRCHTCHAPPAFTSPKLYDVGLADSQGNDRFNPPSLLGVGQRAPYFHDNRAATLADIFTDHAHQLERDLAGDEFGDLLKFLRSL